MTVKTNPVTGGQCTVFQKGENFYYGDRSFVPYIGMETMIFPCTEDGEVVSWGEVYFDRSGRSLEECVEEFLSEV